MRTQKRNKAAQECLPNNDVRDAFAAEFSVLGKLWEAISPDPVLLNFETDYRWLSQVYASVQPQNVHVYQLHQDESLFEKAYGYIKQYY